MTSLRLPVALVSAAFVTLLVGCASSAAPASSSGDPVGTWGTPGERSVHLVLEADGTRSGSDGCNGFSGTWSQKDASSAVEFDGGIMSLMYCDGDQWLTAARTAIVDGDTIHVLDEDGETIGSLGRQ